MTSRDIQTAFNDMQSWLSLARTAEQDGSYANRVVISLYIKAVIRGNDILCLHYLGKRPRRHNESVECYATLCEDHHIDEQTYSKYRSNLSELMQRKAAYEYKSSTLSLSAFRKLKKQATRFIDNAVRDHVDEILDR